MGIVNAIASDPTWLYLIVSSVFILAVAAVVACVYHFGSGSAIAKITMPPQPSKRPKAEAAGEQSEQAGGEELLSAQPPNFSKALLALPNSYLKRYSRLLGSNSGKRTSAKGEKKTPLSEDTFNAIYRDIVISQTKKQFSVALVMSIAGFAVIVAAVILAFFSDRMENMLGTIPGVLSNIISVLFFKQSKDAREEVDRIYRQDEFMANIGRVLAIADKIEDPKIKSALLAALALNMSNPDEKLAADLKVFLGNVGGNTKPQQGAQGS